MTGHEGKEVIGSVQYCALNKSACGKASMIGHEEKGLQAECSIVL